MKRILIIDESQGLRELAASLLKQDDIVIDTASNGLEGNTKIRSEIPDLIIMDMQLERMNYKTLLTNKKNNPNTSHIPVILLSSGHMSKKALIEAGKLGVRKFVAKPVTMESLLEAVSGILEVHTKLDKSPCAFDIHLKEDVVFVEVAIGLNTNKTELIKCKIKELIQFHKVRSPKVLLMLSDITFEEIDKNKLVTLIFDCMDGADLEDDEAMRVLTASDKIDRYIKAHYQLSDIAVFHDLESAMKGFVTTSREDFLFTEEEKSEKEAIDIRSYIPEEEADVDETALKIAVVDDDKIVHAVVRSVFKEYPWQKIFFTDGKEFLDAGGFEQYSAIILDLLMPQVSGFSVLETLKEGGFLEKVIVLTSSTKREDVLKVMSYGIKNYIIKPIEQKSLTDKVMEVLGL